MNDKVTNVVIAGLGGQGVLKASDMLAQAAFQAGYDVKKSEIHGMSQRGGSVSSDVRFGSHILSPMVPAGQADFLVVLDPTQIENNRPVLKHDGMVISPDLIDADQLENKRSLNVALLGVLSRHLPLDESVWLATIQANLPEKLHDVNARAFALGRKISPAAE